MKQNTLDQIAELVCADRQAELDRLRQRIEDRHEEAYRLAHRYEYLIFGGAHDLYDFLMGGA